MNKIPHKRFQYHKDHFDWIFIGIMIFTLFCFALVFYGIDYFESRSVSPGVAPEGTLEELIENRDKLQQKIDDYFQEESM